MMKRTFGVLTVVLLTVLGIAACGSGSSDRGQDVSGGTVGETTNALTSSGVVDLFLDQAIFDANITPNYGTVHPDLEIHVMNTSNELIGCIGAAQDPFMNFMGDAVVTYADIGGQFVFSSGSLPAATEPLTFRLIEKYSSNLGCPSPYIGTTREENAQPDYILASVEATIDDAIANGVDFPSFGIFYMRNEAAAPRAVALSPNVAGGQLALDQLRINEFNTGAGETSNPEIALYILEYGSLDVTACAELTDVDAGSVLFGTLAYGFANQAGNAIALSDIDAAKDYWFFLVERDTGDVCPTDISGKVVLAYTGAVGGADFLAAPIDFENDYGSLDLYTK